tara:strand:- start:11 stop:478 length:468 start_codon:yes stop_codon:yes gene_type:complete
MFMYSKYSETSERRPLSHFKTLSFFVACTKCRSEFIRKLKNDPPPEGKHELFKWIWQFKNEVNKRQREHLPEHQGKKDISLTKAKKNQYAMSDFAVMSNFFQKLIPSMPALPHDHYFRGRNRYKLYRVNERLKRLVQDILDIPNMSVLLTSTHCQ